MNDQDEDQAELSEFEITPNILLIVFAQLAVSGAYYTVTFPLWGPVAAYQWVKNKLFPPPPPPKPRGTVRPLSPINEKGRLV